MPIQVNARLDDPLWERVVEAMPGMSNAERMSQLVHHHLALLDSRRDLPEALALMERMLAPALQALREQNLKGKGSELTEILAQTVTEACALLLSHADRLRQDPARTVPELEALLVQRWTRATLHVLRGTALEPNSIRNLRAVQPEVQRVFDEARLLGAAQKTRQKESEKE